jgi:hypothetical protein
MTNLNTGAAPNPARRRRNATVPMVPLPAAGRKGRPPKWPLGPDIVTRARLTVARDKVEELEGRLAEGERVSEAALVRAREKVAVLEQVVEVQADREAELWREVWAMPQAVQWERLRWTRTVAQYVRWEVLGESGDMDASKEARQLGDRLGMTPLSLLRLRWEIVDDAGRVVSRPPAGPPPAPGSATVTPISRRQRLSG